MSTYKSFDESDPSNLGKRFHKLESMYRNVYQNLHEHVYGSMVDKETFNAHVQ